MTTLIIFHEVTDGSNWAKAWKKGAGSRHEMFEKYGFKARTFRNSSDPNSTGLIIDVPDMIQFRKAMETPEIKKAMGEDGPKLDTFRILSEFTL